MPTNGYCPCLREFEPPGSTRARNPGFRPREPGERGSIASEAWETRALPLTKSLVSCAVAEVKALQAILGGVVRHSAETADVGGPPFLETSLLIEGRDMPMIPCPPVATLGERVVPKIVHFLQNVIEESKLTPERVNPVSISQEHFGTSRVQQPRP